MAAARGSRWPGRSSARRRGARFWGVGEADDSQLLQALGYFGFLLNLFNLIPIGFLDGGPDRCAAFEYLRRGGAHDEGASSSPRLRRRWRSLLVAGMIGSHVSQHRL